MDHKNAKEIVHLCDWLVMVKAIVELGDSPI